MPTDFPPAINMGIATAELIRGVAQGNEGLINSAFKALERSSPMLSDYTPEKGERLNIKPLGGGRKYKLPEKKKRRLILPGTVATDTIRKSLQGGLSKSTPKKLFFTPLKRKE
jgi:hypothetical protein